MGFSTCVFLSGFLLTCAGLNVLGPSGPLSVKLGGSVMLPCYIETPVPLEELEVEWKRTDSESLVHLFQDGEIRPESQSQAYSERAEFFTEEIQHGNFSLLITNITTEDAGVYNCSVYRLDESAQISVQIKEIERLELTGGDVINAYVGESVTLNCSLDSHIPPEEIEEVAWKRVDNQIPVLIFKEGVVQTIASHERYMDRVEFFSLDEFHKGNFSLRLKDLRTEDKGLYLCEAFFGEFSANTTVEVRQLGFSEMHILVLCLCALAFWACPAYSYLNYKFLKRNDNRRMPVQCALVLFPNIAMFIAFILWGVIEGFFGEAATCSALNLLRIVLLFHIAPYLNTFQECVRRFIERSAFLLEYAVTTTIAYLGIVVHLWRLHQEKQNNAQLGFLGIQLTLLLLLYIIIFLQGFKKINTGYLNYCLIAVYNAWRGSTIVSLYGRNLYTLLILILPIVFWYILYMMIFCFLKCRSDDTRNKRKTTDVSILVSALISEVLNIPASIYIHSLIPETDKERVGLMCVAVYLHMLILNFLLKYISFVFAENFSNLNTGGTEQTQRHGSTETQETSGSVLVYIFGPVVPVCVNSIALAVVLILKAQNGERTVEDLRVIVFPSECVFALCFLTLQISEFWRKHRAVLLVLFGCTQTSVPSNPVEGNHELEVLQPTQAAPTPQDTGIRRNCETQSARR